MIERLKVPEAHNDNLSPGELREQRKRELIEHSSFVQRTRGWIQEMRSSMNVVDFSGNLIDHMQAVAAALSSLEEVLKEADKALDRAEQEPNSSEAFKMAQAAINNLTGAFDETQVILEGEDED